MAGFFDRFFRQPVQSMKESAAGRLLVMTPGQPVWSDRNYKAFAEEAYRRNNIAFRAIGSIADAVASVPWTAWRGETELSDHPVLELLRAPNPGQSGPQYMRAKVGFLMLAGNGYEESVVVNGQVRELYQLRPDRMKIIPGDNGFPRAYVYKVGQREVRFDVDPNTMDGLVRHMKLFHPTDDWYGMSPIEAGAYAVDQHNEAASWIQSLLQKSAQPSGALIAKDEQVSDESFNRLKAQIEEQYSGAQNAGRPMLLEGGLDWRQMGMSPVDMQLIETKYSAARDIALALGVPPQLLGIPGDNTYSNYQEARLAFWEDTIIPLLDLIAADWNASLGERFGVELRPNIDQVPAIVEKKQALWQMLEASASLTINEKREAMGYEPIDGGDTILVGASQISLEDATQPLGSSLSRDDAKSLAYGMDSKVTPLKGAK